jgi:hypothetical protein
MIILHRYVLVLGIFLAALGLLELVFPMKAFAAWKKWSSNRFFFLHGIVLIAGGFPLTLYRGPLSTLIFIMGFIVVVTGPFLLIYPEKFRGMFGSIEDEISPVGIKKMIITEALVRILAGIVFITASFI